MDPMRGPETKELHIRPGLISKRRLFAFREDNRTDAVAQRRLIEGSLAKDSLLYPIRDGRMSGFNTRAFPQNPITEGGAPTLAASLLWPLSVLLSLFYVIGGGELF